jgi:hypothetical protein
MTGHKERPPAEAGGRHKILATRFRPQRIAGGNDTPQPTLEDYVASMARNARDTGLQSSAHHDVEWCERVLNWTADLEPGVELDADDIRVEFGALAGCRSGFQARSQAHLIECIGMSESRAVTRHRGLQRRWVRT